VWHDSFICVTWLIHMCDMTHSYVWHDSFIRVTYGAPAKILKKSALWFNTLYRMAWIWLFEKSCDPHAHAPQKSCDIFRAICAAAHSCVAEFTRIILRSLLIVATPYHIWKSCDVQRIWRAMCVTWLIHTYDMTHSCVWHDSCTHMLSCHTYSAPWHHMCEWVMSHRWMSHVIFVNESCHTDEWVTSHVWMSHVTQMNESCHMCEWVMSHRWMSHVIRVNESCHTDEWVMSYVWMSHVRSHTYSAPWHHVCVWVMSHTHVCVWVMSHTHVCVWVMSHTHVCVWVMSHTWRAICATHRRIFQLSAL